MQTRRRWPITVLATLMFVPVALMQEKGGQEEFGPYELVETGRSLFLAPKTRRGPGDRPAASMPRIPTESGLRSAVSCRMPEKAKPGEAVGLYKMNANQMRPKTRWTNQVIVVDREGKLVQSWTQHDALLAKGGKGPHKIKMSPYHPEKHVWVVNDSGDAVFKFSYDGKLVMTLGEVDVQGADDTHFAEPTDIDWLPDGTFYVADGYINTRIVKFDKNGKFLMAWGTKPKDAGNPGPSEFNTPHSVAVGRTAVSTLRSRACQGPGVRREWQVPRHVARDGVPYYLLMSREASLGGGWTRQQVLEDNLNGKFLYGWAFRPRSGTVISPGSSMVLTSIRSTRRTTLLAEVYGGRAQKFRPRKGADPAKLMQPEFRYPTSSN